MTTFGEALAEDRRLAALQILTGANLYTLPEVHLAKALAGIGHAVARDQLRTELAWLEEQGLVILQQPGGVWLATLTQRGNDVAAGLARTPGVARPGPGG